MSTIRSTGLFKVAGPRTFRLAMGAVFDGSPFEIGRNWQNIEKGKRRIVVAPPGHRIVQVDQSGADARIVAWEAPRGNFRALFEHGIKPHVFVALRRFRHEFARKVPDRAEEFLQAAETPIESLTKLSYWKDLKGIIQSSDNWPARERYYFTGKTQCHSLNYGCEWKIYRDTLIKRSEGTIFLPEKEARYDIQAYRDLFPEIFKKWHPRVLAEAWANKCLRNLFGHPFNITFDINKSVEKELYSIVPQSTVALITILASIKLQEFIRTNKLRWQLFANTHDSYASYVPESEVDLAKQKKKEFMEMDLVSTLGEPFKMFAGVSSGKNWAPFDEVKNPDGLIED